METCIVSEYLEPGWLQLTRPEITRAEISALKKELLSKQPKKYLYCMIGDTESEGAQEFHKTMKEKIMKERTSMIVYEGFYDWNNEPGREFERQFQEKMEKSEFVIAVYQNSDSQNVERIFQLALCYHLSRNAPHEKPSTNYIPVLLNCVEQPLHILNMSVINFSSKHMKAREWDRLTSVLCDNINMLRISAFQKFDHCLLHGLNLFLRAMKALDSLNTETSIVELGMYEHHIQNVFTFVINNLNEEIRVIKDESVLRRETYEKAFDKDMKHRVCLFVTLLQKVSSCLLIKFPNRTHLFQNFYNIVSTLNKLYWCAKLTLMQLKSVAGIAAFFDADHLLLQELQVLDYYLSENSRSIDSVTFHLMTTVSCYSELQPMSSHQFSGILSSDLKRSRFTKISKYFENLEEFLHVFSNKSCFSETRPQFVTKYLKHQPLTDVELHSWHETMLLKSELEFHFSRLLSHATC